MMKKPFIALPLLRAFFCVTLFVTATLIMTAPRTAYAVCVCCCNPDCPCSINEAIDNNQNLVDNHQDTRDHFGAAAHPFTMDLLVLYAIYTFNAASPIGIDIRGNEQGDGRIGDHQVFIWEKIWFNNDTGLFLPIWMYMAEQFTTTMVTVMPARMARPMAWWSSGAMRSPGPRRVPSRSRASSRGRDTPL